MDGEHKSRSRCGERATRVRGLISHSGTNDDCLCAQTWERFFSELIRRPEISCSVRFSPGVNNRFSLPRRDFLGQNFGVSVWIPKRMSLSVCFPDSSVTLGVAFIKRDLMIDINNRTLVWSVSMLSSRVNTAQNTLQTRRCSVLEKP
jgi:hypothetical protein